MRVLLVTNRVPFPANSGYPIVIYNTVKGLLEEGAEVTVFSLNATGIPPQLAALNDPMLSKIGFHSAEVNQKLSAWEIVRNVLARKSSHVARFYKSVPVAKLKNLLHKNSYDIIQLEGLFVMPYLNLVRQHSTAKIVYRAHTIEHLVRGTTSSAEQSPLRRLYQHLLSRRLRKFELQNLNRTDAVLTINRSDKSHLESLGCRVNIENLPFTIDPQDYRPDASKCEFPSLFHIGTLDSFPAIEGIEWFIGTVWKDLQALDTGLKLHVAGTGIPDDFYVLENDRLIIHDTLDDARAFINSKPIMVVPLRTGSGMRVKIIEGMAMKKCIISTSMGAEGINYEHGKNILIADTPDEFYKYILQAVTNRRFCDEIGENARKLVEKEYNLKTGAAKLMHFYRGLTRDLPSRSVSAGTETSGESVTP